MKAIYVLIIISLVLFAGGCGKKAEKITTIENTSVTNITNITIVDETEIEESELYSAEIERGTCPVEIKSDCSLGYVCGSDDRTYKNACDACNNSIVDNWIIGEC